jgi:hypothetical protein
MPPRDPRQLNDTDLLVNWAGEEFVAAGRVEDEEIRQAHRRMAAFLVEAYRQLRTPGTVQDPLEKADTPIAEILKLAFGSPWRRRS